MGKPNLLNGIRVVDFTHIVAGPQCTRILGDLGAQVIRVENEQGLDSTRTSPIKVGGGDGINRSGMFEYFNRNKLSITINARLPLGLELIKRLISVSDVVIENFSSRVLENWGLSYKEMCKVKPDIIYTSITGFGHNGRDREYSTWGPTAQALSGLTMMSGLPGERPAGWGYSFLDHTAGYNAAIAILMALHYKNKTGKGQWLDLSQIETGMVLTGPSVLDYTVNGRPYRREGSPPGNRSRNPRVAPHNTYKCIGDDRWCVISIFNEAEWGNFCNTINRKDLLNNPKFITNSERILNEDDLDSEIQSWTLTKSPEEVMTLLQNAGVPAGIVQNNEDKFEKDPQLQAREFFPEVLHRDAGEKFPTDGFPVKFSHTEANIRAGSPPLGADTEFVLKELLEMEDEEIATLYEEAAIL